MAFFEPKETILDVKLTDLGRNLLAKNQLQFNYYAFSDDGIDYSGSLALTNFTGSIDNIVFKNLSTETPQYANKELNSYLYTVNTFDNKIPQLVVSISTGSLLQLKRRYKTWSGQEITKLVNLESTSKPLDIIMKANIQPENRVYKYVFEQNVLPLVSGALAQDVGSGGTA
jgi:hypothetical protein